MRLFDDSTFRRFADSTIILYYVSIFRKFDHSTIRTYHHSLFDHSTHRRFEFSTIWLVDGSTIPPFDDSTILPNQYHSTVRRFNDCIKPPSDFPTIRLFDDPNLPPFDDLTIQFSTILPCYQSTIRRFDHSTIRTYHGPFNFSTI